MMEVPDLVVGVAVESQVENEVAEEEEWRWEAEEMKNEKEEAKMR